VIKWPRDKTSTPKPKSDVSQWLLNVLSMFCQTHSFKFMQLRLCLTEDSRTTDLG